ncbi:MULTISPECIES: CBS domain-containing protein [Emticicia]|uniref:CBS domain-containing protein n=1 Tax=Emticicia TaxID=312278 RepID=UPI0020A0AF7A|nr:MULTISPECIES: CBS domain-containing protein [Emticicia]UTA67299.1 CBS domain-containing protein [Emticicia sp. 21SJ11W-3]
MTAAQIINHELPILKLTDTVGDALSWMEENRISQLVVVDNEQYQGILSEDILLNYDEELAISEVMPQYTEAYIFDDQHLYEALGLISKFQLQILGVVDEDKVFTGAITATEIYNRFGELLGVQEPGAVLVIAIKNRDYSLAEISRLVESDNAKILSSYFNGSEFGEENASKLTLKINRKNISSIVATLERFGYMVEGAYAHEPIDSIEQERYDMLMKYLSV